MKTETRSRVGVELEERTLVFSVAMVRFAESLSATAAGRVVAAQMLRSAMSIGANYREANRAESKADFAHKIGVALKEAAETEYWLLVCARTPLGDSARAQALRQEADEPHRDLHHHPPQSHEVGAGCFIFHDFTRFFFSE